MNNNEIAKLIGKLSSVKRGKDGSLVSININEAQLIIKAIKDSSNVIK